MKKYLLLASVVLTGAAIGGAYASIDCSTLPSCSELGYSMTASECGNMSKLKCPFGEYYFCPTELEEAKVVDCENGSILYDDFKCYTGFPTDKVPLGVVFDFKKNLAVTFDEGDYTSWEKCKTINNLGETSECQYDTADMPFKACNAADGCLGSGICNTNHPKFESGEFTKSPVLDACNAAGHDPKGYITFVPNVKELRKILNMKNKFNEALKQVRKHYSSYYDTYNSDEIHTTGFYWSSDVYGEDYANAVPYLKHSSTYDYEFLVKAIPGPTRCAFYYDTLNQDNTWLEEKCSDKWTEK